MKSESNRIVYLDLLRIVSCFAVIVLHTAAQYWEDQPPSSYAWQVFNVYDSVSRFCVPVLVMISGVFFLNANKDIPLKKLYGKYILRLLTAYIFWSLFYAAVHYIGSEEAFTLTNVLESAFFDPATHLWFLPMLIGIYILVPLLRPIVKNGGRYMQKYFLTLFFIFGICIPTVMLFEFPGSDYVGGILTRFPVDLVCGFAGYFVLGYYIFTYDVSRRFRIASYIAGVLSILTCIFVTSYYSVSSGKPNELLYEYLAATTFFVSAAIFTFFKYVVSKIRWPDRCASMVQSISLCTFGVYLIHIFFLELFDGWGFTALSFDPVLSVPAIALSVFAASLVTIFALRKIPKVNKFIM
jgi:surface polysaccharide O-acyltransferase-like enzyme